MAEVKLFITFDDKGESTNKRINGVFMYFLQKDGY